MGHQSIRKPSLNPDRKPYLPGDPEPGELAEPMPKPSFPGDPELVPKRPGPLPDPIQNPTKK